MVSPQDIKGWIEENLPGATVEISGDGHHFEAEIICTDFAGKSPDSTAPDGLRGTGVTG